MRNYLRVTLVLFFLLATTTFSQNKCRLFIIGGGSETNEMLNSFVEMAGGKNSKIVILPMASSIPETVGLEYETKFKSFGADAFSLNINKDFVDSDEVISKFQNITAVFFTGGDQSRLTSVLQNTKLENKIFELFKKGVLIGGTSAGAAVMSEVMITGNELLNNDSSNSFVKILSGNIETKKGFGFLKNVIIDQHFVFRKRHNRLTSVVLENPKLIGVGIDENTAIVFEDENKFKVIGSGSVLIYDARKANSISKNKNGILRGNNIILTILSENDSFNIN
ncbi:MAG: cyanophycinase [Bacteroidetes bacterium]|nr:cyanophycinase [Bacteroidota bacterium]